MTLVCHQSSVIQLRYMTPIRVAQNQEPIIKDIEKTFLKVKTEKVSETERRNGAIALNSPQ